MKILRNDYIENEKQLYQVFSIFTFLQEVRVNPKPSKLVKF